MNPESGLPDRVPEPPCVVIHSLADARIVLDAAVAAGGLPVLLLSAPEAACFMGPPWWRALIDAAVALHTSAVPDLLDCGDAAGRAMQALRIGQKELILDPACPQYEAVVERAVITGASIRSTRPAALDLAEHGAERLLHAWLTNAPGGLPEARRDKSRPVG